MKESIVAFSPRHWAQVREILTQCLHQNTATFFHTAPSLVRWEQGHLPQGRLVYLDAEGQVQGWAALQPVESPREAEVSVYVNPSSQGQGIGSALLSTLLDRTKEAAFEVLWAQILENNLVSQRLHGKFGFSFHKMETHPHFGGQRVCIFRRIMEL